MHFGVSFVEMLLVALFLGPASGGGFQNDLVSLFDPADYFSSRRIEGVPKGLLQLLARPPAGPQEEIAQLLAVRRLAELRSGPAGA